MAYEPIDGNQLTGEETKIGAGGLGTTGPLVGSEITATVGVTSDTLNVTGVATVGSLSASGSVAGATLDITAAPTAAAATAGTVVPTDFVGFMEITLNGATVKIPYYNP